MNKILCERIARFWYDENYYIAQYEYKDNSFILYNANPIYLNVNNIDEHYFGMSITKIFPVLTYEYIFNIYNSLIDTDKPISYVRERNNIFYESNIFLCNGLLTIIYKKTENKRIGDFSNRVIDNLEFSNLSRNLKFNMVIDKINDTYVIDKFCENTSTFVGNCVKIGDDVVGVFNYKSLWLRSRDILDMCLKDNNPIRLPEIIFNNNIAKYFVMTIIPIRQYNNKDSIVIVSVEITKIEFFNLQNYCFKLNKFSQQEIDFDVCSLNINGIKNNIGCFLENQTNAKFFEYLKMSGIDKSAIVENEEIINNITSRQTFTYDFITRDGKVVKIIFTQKSKENVILVLIIKNNVESKSNKLMLSKLTTREREIVQLILEGAKNIEIASILKISEGTVKKTLYNIYKKLDITNRVELTRNYYL